MCTSIVRPPTTTSLPQTFSKISSRLNTRSGLEAKRAINSNSLRGNKKSVPWKFTLYVSRLISKLFNLINSSFGASFGCFNLSKL